MCKTIAKLLLGTALLSMACEGHERGMDVDLATNEDVSTSYAAALDDEGLSGEAEGYGAYKLKAPGDPKLSRRQAIEAARSAGLLGSSRVSGMGALTPSTDFSSGFDDSYVYGVLGGGDTMSRPRFHDAGKNPWIDTAKDRVSTFAADVDTASYTLSRRLLREGELPPPAGVRVEEFVNYFHYRFPEPTAGTPFAVVMDAAPSPFAAGRHVVRVGVATKAKSTAERQTANLVFLVDVSGSMDEPDKLALAKRALRVLTNNLTANDTVALVTYAGATRVVLPATGMHHRERILAAIESLGAGGSTAMGSGLDLAYREAIKGLRPNVTSRVVVLSDGDANVGAQTHEELLKVIASRAKEGVTLTTVGFGTDNYRDDLMEQLADRGNGNNFYVDDIEAATKVFQEDLVANLEVVAKDVKLQVDFDPAMVARYRLIGYENRDIADKDFRNDKVDAGEVGAGHQVTAMYEVELTAAGRQANAPIGAVRIRHKPPQGSDQATEAAFPMIGGPASTFAKASQDLRFAFAVAAFADVLRGSDEAAGWSLARIRDLARANAGVDLERLQLVELIDRAIRLRRAS